MKTIIKRHAIWNSLLAATAYLSGHLCSSRVTYGVAGQTMFDAPLVKNREAARSPAAVRSSRAGPWTETALAGRLNAYADLLLSGRTTLRACAPSSLIFSLPPFLHPFNPLPTGLSPTTRPFV
jgi:hypothetical protein